MGPGREFEPADSGIDDDDEDEWEEVSLDDLEQVDGYGDRPVLSIPPQSSPSVGCLGFLLLLLIGLGWGFAFSLILAVDS